jgi:uncharacterized protein (DUF433 family)
MGSEPALVTTDPDVCAGRPCFAGHRLPIATVLSRLDARESLAELQRDHPWLTDDHIAAARGHAASGRAKRFGLLKGKVTLASDFDAPLPDSVLGGFQGEAALEGLEDMAASRVLDEAGLDDELEPPAAPKPAPAPSKAQEAGRRLADLGGRAPDIEQVPRRRPAG